MGKRLAGHRFALMHTDKQNWLDMHGRELHRSRKAINYTIAQEILFFK